MAEFKTWLEYIENERFDEQTKEQLVNEMPHTHFIGGIPNELGFLRGAFVDLNFENLGLTAEDHRKIRRAFGGNGISVPGTSFRLRHNGPGQSLVELKDGTEQAALPDYWKQAVLVMNNDDQFTWIGKLVRPDQIGKIDLTLYHDIGDAYVMKDA